MTRWDSAMDLELERTIALPIGEIWQSCALPADSRLGVSTGWISEATSLRGQSNVEVVSFGNDRQVTVSVNCPGRELGHAVKLRTVIFLLPGLMVRESGIAPSIPGSILWEDVQRVVLEGDGSRFPTEVIDFRHLPGVSPGAAWHLEWDPSALDLTVSAAIRLYLNSDCPAFVQSITNVNPTEIDLERQRTVRWDVARRLITGAISVSEFAQSSPSTWEEGTVGYAIHALLALHLPGRSATALAQLRSSSPSNFETDLLAALMSWPRG
jgi:hypothetical protein